ncbi:MAG: hypothetical protein GY827_04615 [Cytophagales bacterium]|nr:hypothetical protein [Cytophagales bacterium]
MERQRGIRITIEGTAGEGKSAIATFIQDTLMQYNIETIQHDEFGESIAINSARANRYNILNGIGERQTKPFAIDVKHIRHDDTPDSKLNNPVEFYEYTPPTIDEIMETLNPKFYDTKPDLVNSRELHESNFAVLNLEDGKYKLFKNRYGLAITVRILKRLGIPLDSVVNIPDYD